MVAGKVKAVMGFQKTPSPAKPQNPRRSSSTPPSQKSQKTPSSAAAPAATQSKTGTFSRSFGGYFPRSSAQVQPRPPDVSDLIRIIEDLRETESRLKTELLEHKLLKETVAIVPFLENEIATKDAAITSATRRVEGLEAENETLRREVERLKERIEKVDGERENRMMEMQNEVAELRRAAEERKAARLKEVCSEIGENDECSSSTGSSTSQRFQGLNLTKSLKKGGKLGDSVTNQESNQKVEIAPPPPPPTPLKQEDQLPQQLSRSNSEMQESAAAAAVAAAAVKARAPRIPKPPPRPSFSSPPSSSSSSSSCSSSSSTTAISGDKNRDSVEQPKPKAMPPPPPPPPVPRGGRPAAPPPPPPPPPPARAPSAGAAKVRRVPEVVEFYHSLMRRDSKRESGTGVADIPSAANARNMIGEIENRSAHLLAVSLL